MAAGVLKGWAIGKIAAIAVVYAAAGGDAHAETQLLMLDEKYCEWCERWTEEVGVIYGKTAEGARAPLRRMSIHEPVPADVTLTSRAHYTPTFVLLDDGVEVGRIEGYPGEDFFWGLLGRLLDDLPPETSADTKVETTAKKAPDA